jgi:3-oxoacyl-[acyl-carrier protein] reductase
MLKQQVAIVTGASRGIGEAILAALARAEATVIGTSTTEAGAEGITKRIAADLECVAVQESASLLAGVEGSSS